MKYCMLLSIYRLGIILLFGIMCTNVHSNIIYTPEIPIVPVDSVESVNSMVELRSGDTQMVSLSKYYYSINESKSICDITVNDTLTVMFDCMDYNYSVGMPLVTPPEKPTIYVSVNKIDNGSGKLYGDFSWSATKLANGNYTIDSKEEMDLLVLLPGSYQLVYGEPILSISPSEVDLRNKISNDSSNVRLKTSVMSITHSSITISMKCSDADPEMIVRVPPSPDISSVNYGLGSAFGDYGVSNSGAATYDLIIETPKYRFTPKLGISYSSHMSGYGLVGYGINISGISVITRTGKNYFYDKDYKGITYTDEDNYLLDGQRLIPTDPGNKNCRSYSIEGNPFSEVIRNSNNGYIWFTIINNGIIYEYGKDPSSINKFTNKNGSERISEWYISNATDANGNYITYNYEKSDMLVYPTLIIYGLNKFLPGGKSSTIAFEYADLGANKRSFIVDNQQGYINKCLKSVTTGTDGLTYRKYLFSYDISSDQANTKFTKLKSVVVHNGAGRFMSPIEFKWNSLFGNIQAHYLRDEMHSIDETDTEVATQYLSSDVNSDGISDIIKISAVRKNGELFGRAYMYISLSKRDADGSILFNQPLITEIPAIREFETKPLNFSIAELPSIVDFNGDGYNDLILTYHFNYDYDMSDKYWIMYGSDISKGVCDPISFEIPLRSKTDKNLLSIFDVDGDGRDEIIYIDTTVEDGYYYGGIIERESGLKILKNLYKFQLPSLPENMFSADYNNDGLIDIIFFYKVVFH